MTRSILLTLVAVLSAGVANADDEANKKAAKELEGSYEMVQMVRDGEAVPAERVKAVTGVTIKDGELILKTGPSEDKATFAVTAGKNPAHIDITSGSGELRPGIYKLEKDELTIVFHTIDKTRPINFDGKGNGARKLVLKKSK